MLNWLLLKMMNPVVDEAVIKSLSEDFPSNPFIIMTAAQKMTPKAMIEASIRAQLGKELQLPYGSPVVLSPWEKLLLNPRQLFQFPTADTESIDTKAVIGPNAKKPLQLDIPIMITGMSYGGSLSRPMKLALAKGAAMAGTSTNTGESAVSNEIRNTAKYLIGQYNRGGLITSHEQLKKLDAIEIQMGQGAWGGAVTSTMKSKQIDPHLRKLWNIKKGEDCTIYARMPNIYSQQGIIDLVSDLKSKYDVPVGIKIAGTDFMEYELEVIGSTDADFIVIDGSEGGTAVAPPTLADNIGLPTLHSLARTITWLENNNLRDQFSVIATGGLTTPGHYLKAMALGADAVYIGSIAVMAAVHSQAIKALPQKPPTQLALYIGELTDKLDINEAALHLSNFLKSCITEMKMAIQAIGKNSINELDKNDLVSVDKDLAEFLGIRYAGSYRKSSKV